MVDTSPILNRFLPERSQLVFYFPNSNGGKPTRVVLPFFENVNISESKSGRYQDFKLFGRSSDLYGYMGADSRKLQLTFNMIFPHIMSEYPSYNIDKVIIDKEPTPLLKKETTPVSKTQANTSTKDYIERSFADDVGLFTDLYKHDTTNEVMLYWINIIRASVMNDSKNPVLGPPLIRLTHGILYQDIPCICKDYSFDIKDNTAYEISTLMPHIINFRLNLEELRTGDFGEYEKYKAVKRDNLVGYEALFTSERSMDPGRLETGPT